MVSRCFGNPCASDMIASQSDNGFTAFERCARAYCQMKRTSFMMAAEVGQTSRVNSTAKQELLSITE
ncbi:hypothetical protein IG631_02764 [Alternaria alternata]|nr:hypothetical protein IG631_02764 [Alternaria alternata]